MCKYFWTISNSTCLSKSLKLRERLPYSFIRIIIYYDKPQRLALEIFTFLMDIYKNVFSVQRCSLKFTSIICPDNWFIYLIFRNLDKLIGLFYNPKSLETGHNLPITFIVHPSIMWNKYKNFKLKIVELGYFSLTV